MHHWSTPSLDCKAPMITMTLAQRVFTALWAFFVSLPSISGSPLTPRSPTCKYLPGDPGWPSPSEWNTLNDTVNGRLIAAVPLAQPCHAPNFNAAECAKIQANWTWPQLQFVSIHDWGSVPCLISSTVPKIRPRYKTHTGSTIHAVHIHPYQQSARWETLWIIRSMLVLPQMWLLESSLLRTRTSV